MTDGDWTTLFEDLLRGLVHAMNNRLTALSALAELAVTDREAIEAPVLQQEITRLHLVSTSVCAIATRNSDAEALQVRDVLDQALTIHSHHPRMRSVPCLIAESGLVLPVRVPRSVLLRLLLLLVDAAKRSGDATREAGVVVQLAGDEAVVSISIRSSESLGGDEARFASACGGAAASADGVWTVTLPSLPALRRRERAS